MKKKMFLFFIINVLICINTYSQFEYFWYDWVTRYTPKGNPITAGVLKEGYELTDSQKIASKNYWLDYYQNRITFISEATRTYNCHGYAWHVSEGQDNVVIFTPNDDKYWTQGSYQETSSQNNAKVAFVESADHSAIRTSHPDTLISKWGQAPKFKHHKNDCPYEPKTNLKYYKLNPGIEGSTEALCSNQERTFTSNTTITGSSYSWTKDDTRLDYVSGSGTTSYRIKAKNTSGNAWVQLQITTPSGEVATTPYKYFWIGIFANNVVTGQAAVCPNSIYTYTAQVPGGHYPSYSYSWTYPSNWMYPYQYQNTIRLQTPMNPYYGTVRVSITNACGTSAYSGITVYPGSGCGGYFTIYPNPASDNVTILINEDTSVAVTSDSEITDTDKTNEPAKYTIRIFSSQSTLLSTITRSGKSFNMPLIDLRDGIYVIEVNDGKNSYRQQLIVKHD